MEDTTTVTTETKKETEESTKPEPPTTPPLEAAARRLEKLLGGGSQDSMYTYGNPVKVTRRWLGTASGASGKATSSAIVAAATALLDPGHADDRTRSLLLAIDTTGTEVAAASMDVEGDAKENPKPEYLTMASRREVESWLLSLQVRILWKEEKYSDAIALVETGIAILLETVTLAAKKVTSTAGRSVSSLFPLLARLYRYRSLVADSMKEPSVTLGLREVLAKAHNMACLRRDVDCQATLINLMLRDLLEYSQGEHRKF
jgi:hypothetical protein